MITKNSLLEIFIYNLLLSVMCRSKLIENESFIRSSRYLKIRPDEVQARTHLHSSDLPVPAETREIQLHTIEHITQANLNDIQDYSITSNETTTLKAITTISSTEKKKVYEKYRKMERKSDNIDERRRQQFFYAKPQNPSNFYLNRTSKYYINYRQAYGIRYDPNKIRRSFNYVKNSDTAEEEPLEDGGDLINEDVDGNDVETHTVQSEKQVFVTEDEAPQTTTDETTTTETSGEISEMSTENSSEKKPHLNNIENVSAEDVLSESLDGTTAPIISNSTTNIMKPSRVQAALQFINTRVKNFIKYGLGPGGTPVVNRANATAAPGNGQRFLNLFNVIKFDNVPCASQLAPLTPLNGTCYHKFECDQLGGVAVDECAGGFGVCCVCMN